MDDTSNTRDNHRTPSRHEGDEVSTQAEADPDTCQRRQSLDQLEGIEWGPPPFESHLVATCHRLRTKPIGDFTPADLRIMIGHEIGLTFLVPLALEVLERDPLIEATFIPGDLLSSVLRVPHDFWRRHPKLRSRLDAIVSGLEETREDVQSQIDTYRTTAEQNLVGD
jgi:hypothetical protein